jgi:Zn-dependent metalloprotease
VALAALVGAALVLAVGCGRSSGLGGGGGVGPSPLTPSAAWQRTVGAETYRERLGGLTAALDRLRLETRSGWVGRQDDVTGYLGELTGGAYSGPGGAGPDPSDVVGDFLSRFGPDLLGVDGPDVAVVSTQAPSPQDPSASVVLRVEQRVNQVPVLDSSLILTVATAGGQAPRLRAVTGRVFPGLQVNTAPTVGQAEALAQAEAASGGHVSGTVRVVVLPSSGSASGAIEAHLAWEVPVTGDVAAGGFGAARYYVDAERGGILSIRPGAADTAVLEPVFDAASNGPIPVAQPQAQTIVSGTPLTVSGTGPIGETETAEAIRTADGRVLLVDITGPSYDPTTGRGAVETHDATGLTDATGGLPGPVVQLPSGAPTDPEALAAQALARAVLDYYRTVLGRDSWDGGGGSLVSSVHYGGSGYCNSFFDGTQMVFGTPCDSDLGRTTTQVEIDTAAHEVTHGVTATSVGGSSLGLIYSGQSGAMNEGFSDYVGNIIGNRVKGIDGAAFAEGWCAGVTQPNAYCRLDPEGGLSLRYLLSGETFGDYLYLLDPSFSLRLAGIGQDHGGVHLNSAIWPNALWGIRTQLATMDGTSGNASPRAGLFDAIVYTALTSHLSPTSGFLDGRTAVELAARELAAPPEIRRVIRETFDRDGICPGCVPDPAVPGVLVAGGTQSEKVPVVSGARTAWLDQSSGAGATGFPTVLDGDGPPARLTNVPSAFSVAFAGSAVVTAETPDGILRYPAEGGRQVVHALPPTRAGFASLVLGVAGSPEGAAWLDRSTDTVWFVDASGVVTTASLGGLSGEPFASIGTGGRTVVLGSGRGAVVVWTVGSAPRVLGRVDGPAVAVAVAGDAVVVSSLPNFDLLATVWLFDLTDPSGTSTVLSTTATPFGLAASGDLVVWPEGVGDLSGGVAQLLSVAPPDSDLFLYDLGTGIVRDLTPERGQQGYPALDGTHLAWQDASRGGDDIRGMDLSRV